jgi:FKBP-type peptidyl-prolyl cis-trans isomerase FkpA
MLYKLINYSCTGLLIYICFPAITILSISCNTPEVEQNKPPDNAVNDALVNINKYLIQKDVEAIRAFIKRNHWNMKKTESGLWYEIYKQGKGLQSANGMIASLKYKAELLDGTFCYSSDSSGYKQFVIGAGKVESGLDEGILKMKQGDAARFILLPHLAYGLVGDNNKVPARAILVYDVELIKLEYTKEKNK